MLYPIGLENGIEDIKSVADYVTDNNDEEGVARAIEKLLVLQHRVRALPETMGLFFLNIYKGFCIHAGGTQAIRI